MISEINEEKIKDYFSEKVQTYQFEIHDEIDSTNARAKQLYAEGTERAVVIAESQTKGRGRLGRSFYSPKGNGIYMSILFKTGREATDAVKVTTFAAVAVSRAVERVSGLKAGIKWVNDIYINEKKVCGILTEAGFSNESRGIDYVIAGIGINVYGREFPEDIRDIATSIEAEIDRTARNNENAALQTPDRNQLIAEILNQMEPFVTGEETDYLEEYRERSVIIGKRVNVINGNVQYPALAVGIDDDCGLIVEREEIDGNVTGERKVITAGEVSIRLQK